MSFYTLLRSFKERLDNRKKAKYIDMLVSNGLILGKNVHIVDTFFFDPAHCFLISIGDNCRIASNVRILAHDASTKAFLGYTKIGKVDIKENCFIGHSALILPGVTIGASSIIGAGSVVTADIPSRSVAVGVPARVICTLDEYLEKVESGRGDKKIYSDEYHIYKIDKHRRAELCEALKGTIGYIV